MATGTSKSDKCGVILDVGGTRFRTTMKTIKGVFDGKKFPERISQESDFYGTIYIDRDPTVFGYILNYLRDRQVIVPRDACLIKQIAREAAFYGITGLEWEATHYVSSKYSEMDKKFVILENYWRK